MASVYEKAKAINKAKSTSSSSSSGGSGGSSAVADPGAGLSRSDQVSSWYNSIGANEDSKGSDYWNNPDVNYTYNDFLDAAYKVNPNLDKSPIVTTDQISAMYAKNGIDPNDYPGGMDYLAESANKGQTYSQLENTLRENIRPDPEEKYASDYVNPLSLASTQTANILTEGSPLLTATQGYANQIANARGLQNSSIGAEIGTSAATKVAADLGKADALMYGASQQANQQGDIASALSAQDFGQSSSLLYQGYGQESALSTQDYNQTTALTQMQNDFAETLAQMGYDHDDTLALTSMIDTSNRTLMNNIGSLLNNTDIEMTDGVVEWMSKFQDSSWASAASILGIDIDLA